MANGARIVEALKDAAAGNLSRVTVEGQTWVRADQFEETVAALHQVTDDYWGVDHDRNGDGYSPPPAVIQRARRAIAAARGAA